VKFRKEWRPIIKEVRKWWEGEGGATKDLSKTLLYQ
jgi:hypothetical protein